MRYSFVIDQNRCIGCHACTVACKEEHNVPVGVFRTWVKYIEKGEFPATSRHFGVMRCNHCEQAPCVEICPTKALHHRDNGIVDFDNSRCIGCKSCMQACPYDALYIDPNTNTAAKCNFCAHRVELNLEPACVIVCPTRSIIAGDLDDPQSEISRIVATQKVSVRKPHKGTQPKLFYVGIDGDLLQPTMTSSQSAQVWAERDGSGIPPSEHRGNDASAPGSARVVYEIAHKQPWGIVPTLYLWTKSIGAGALIVAAILLALGFAGRTATNGLLVNKLSAITALVFTAITSVLLIADLKRPERFYYILIKPNPRSWLVWGTYALMIYSAAAFAWAVFGFLGRSIPVALICIAAAGGIGAACYSAFLFAQAKGRDLWQSPLFLWHLLVQATLAGAAAILILGFVFGIDAEMARVLAIILLASTVVSLLMVAGEASLTAFSEDLHRAVQMITRGGLRPHLWIGVVLIGTLIPVVLLAFALVSPALAAPFDLIAALTSLLGLLVLEYVWIKAGQSVPLS